MLSVVLAIALAAAGPEAAQVVSAAPEAAAITIYRGPAFDEGDGDVSEGLAQITETRTVELPAGRSWVSFRGVADTMVAQTAAIEGLPGAVLERNQDYDLLSPGALMKASVGETVRLVRTNRQTGAVTEQTATIRSAGDGVVLQTADGLEALSCSGLPERLVFDHVPEGLRDKPTLSVLADAPAAGRYKLRLSYLATGFNWSADYVARINPDGRTLDLSAWLTLTNHTATGFDQVPTQVVAGELSRSDETTPKIPDIVPLSLTCWPRQVQAPRVLYDAVAMSAPPMMARSQIEEVVVTSRSKIASQSELGDYKLYTLPEPTTVAARQTKQVLFLDQKAVRFERLYAYRFEAEDGDIDEEDIPDTPGIVLRLNNRADAGLGKPLPTGVFAVMQDAADGRPVLAGEHRASQDTPVGLTLDLKLGQAMDVLVEPRVVAEASDADGGHYDVVVTLANGKTTPILLEYRHAPYGDSFKVTGESQRHITKAGDPMWVIRLAAGQRKTLRYAVRYKQ